jgi:hypothetical protein
LDTGLIWLNLFDDYPTFCPSNVSHVVRPATKLLFNLLGWQFADSPEKDLEFAADFVALGVVFDISKLEHGLSQVKHKPKRSSEVKEQLYNVLSEGSFSATLAASLRGKLQLMESATCGNAARGTFRVFKHADTVAHKLLNREDRETLHWFVKMGWTMLQPEWCPQAFKESPFCGFQTVPVNMLTWSESFLVELSFMIQEIICC